MFKKSPLKATRLAQRKRRIFIWKIIAVSIGIILFFAAIVGVTHLKLFQINTISVSGNSGVDASSVIATAVQDLQSPYLHLFSKYNRFLYPKNKIKADLLKAFPRLQTVTMSVQGHDLHISVTERDPSYIWCEGEPDQGQTQDCYFMDTTGYIFSPAPIFSGHAFFAYYGLVGTSSPITSHYLSTSDLEMIKKVSLYLSDHNLPPYALLANNDRSFDLYFASGSKIIFNADQDADELVLNLETLMNDPNVFGKSATTSLQYLDLRFGNKVYYRKTNSGDNSTGSTQ